jgi:hypothetical protein
MQPSNGPYSEPNLHCYTLLIYGKKGKKLKLTLCLTN